MISTAFERCLLLFRGREWTLVINFSKATVFGAANIVRRHTAAGDR